MVFLRKFVPLEMCRNVGMVVCHTLVKSVAGTPCAGIVGFLFCLLLTWSGCAQVSLWPDCFSQCSFHLWTSFNKSTIVLQRKCAFSAISQIT